MRVTTVRPVYLDKLYPLTLSDSACLNVPGRKSHSVVALMLREATAIISLISAILSYSLSDELRNTGEHAADAVSVNVRCKLSMQPF